MGSASPFFLLIIFARSNRRELDFITRSEEYEDEKHVVLYLTRDRCCNHRKWLLNQATNYYRYLCNSTSHVSSWPYQNKLNLYSHKHRWFSGRMLACHAGGPGSIPGRCIFYFYFKLDLLISNISVLCEYNFKFRNYLCDIHGIIANSIHGNDVFVL